MDVPDADPAPQTVDHDAQERALAGLRRVDADVGRLQAMSYPQLQQLATDEAVAVPPGLGRKELVFEILRARLQDCGLGYVEGALEVLADGFGFLRSPLHDYAAGADDVYVSPSQIRRLNLKSGHLLAGPVRPPGRGEKYFALAHIDLVNGADAGSLHRVVPFAELLPVLPHRRLRLQHPGAAPAARLLDLLAPWGHGQRILVQAPPGSRRTLLLTQLAAALAACQPQLYQIVCLLDERPEDVTEVRQQLPRGPQREVVATSFELPALRHLQLAEMALAKAMRMVEAGVDVVLLLDSLTSLVRASAHELPTTGKVLAPGLDVGALQRGKRLFGAARQADGGASLTVLATVLVGTGSRLDEVIAAEFQNRGNSTVALDAQLCEQHCWPAIDVLQTGTRRDDQLLPAADIDRLRRLRQQLAAQPREVRLDRLLAMLQLQPDNDALLRQLP